MNPILQRVRTVAVLTVVFAFLSGFLGANLARANNPLFLGYQGRLYDEDGDPIGTGLSDMTFRIYDAEAGGTLLYTETQLNVPLDDGYFAVSIGEVTPLLLPFDAPYWLSTEVNGDGEMDPRARINAVGYSYVSGGVQSLDADPTLILDGGQMYYNTTLGELRYFDDVGALDWVTIGDATLWQDETVLGDWDNTANPWAADEIDATVMIEGEDISLLNNDTGYVTAATETDPIWLADEPDYANLWEAEVINSDWDNTLNPWADGEVADILTVGAGSTVDDAALSANVSLFGASVDSVEITDGAVTGTDVSDNSLNFADFVNAMALDASTSITMDDAEAFTITNGSTANAVVNLTSTGDFVIQDSSTIFFTLSDTGAITAAARAASQLSTNTGTFTLSTTAGGAANSLILSSNDTSADAIDVNATGSGGGIDVDTTNGGITIDAGGAVNGDISLTAGDDMTLTAVGDITLNSAGSVYLATDDDLIPTLGASDANLGAVGTPWDNLYATDVICTDCLDFTEFVDAMSLDASTSIAMDGAETLTITNGSTANTVINLTSSGDFIIQDAGTTWATFSDGAVFSISDGGIFSENVTNPTTTPHAVSVTQSNNASYTLGKSLTYVDSAAGIASARYPAAESITASFSGSTSTSYTLKGLAVSADTYSTSNITQLHAINAVANVGSSGNVGTLTPVFSVIDAGGSGTVSSEYNFIAENNRSAGSATEAGVLLGYLNLSAGHTIGTLYGSWLALTGASAVTTAYGVRADVDVGTTRYGFYSDVSGGTTNWAFYSPDATADSAFLDDVFIGGTSETLSNAGFILGGDDLFVAGMAGVEGSIYTDSGLVVGASTTYADGSVTASGTLTFDSSGTVRLGTDDDFLPQLGASDANIGAIATPWDNLYATNVNATDVICTDCLDFAEFVDAMSLDASTSIAMDDAETFTITNGSTADAVINLSSSGDLVIKDNGTTFATFDDSAAFNLTDGGKFNLNVTDPSTAPLSETITLTNNATYQYAEDFRYVDNAAGITSAREPVAQYIRTAFNGSTTSTYNLTGMLLVATSNSASTINDLTGIKSWTNQQSTGTVNNMYNFRAYIDGSGAGTAGSEFGYYAELSRSAGSGTEAGALYGNMAIPSGHTIGTLYGAKLALSSSSSVTTSYGVRADVDTGTTRYGFYADVPGGTTKWAFYSPNSTSDSAFVDNVYIGSDAAETLSNAGFSMNGDDLFVADTAGVEGNIYTDSGLVVGATTTYANGSIIDTDSAADDLFDFSLATASDSFRIVTGNLRVGTGSPTLALNGEDAYVSGKLEVDEVANIAGTLTANDFACVSGDCLDFSDFASAMALDESTSIAMDDAETFTITNGSTANAIVNLTSTGDFVIHDNGTPFATFSDTGTVLLTNGVRIGADSTNNLIDDASNGAGSTTLYIGTNTIDTTVPSDVNLKYGIVPTELTITDLMAIEVVDFRFIPEFSSDQSLHHGVIAQQVEGIFPEAVSTRSDGYKMVDYKAFIPLLMKSVQEQQLAIEALQNTAPVEQAGSVDLIDLILDGELKVKGHAAFNGDTVGQVRLLPWQDAVDVVFAEEYQDQPIVTLTLATDVNVDRYWVEKVTAKGFTVRISPSFEEEVTINWHAFGANQGIVFVSDGTTEQIELVLEELVCNATHLANCDTLEECQQILNFYWDGQCRVNDPEAGMINPEEQVPEQPIVESSEAGSGNAGEPAVEEPAAEEPVVDEPVVEEPIAEEVVVEDVVAEPAPEEPAPEEPAV